MRYTPKAYKTNNILFCCSIYHMCTHVLPLQASQLHASMHAAEAWRLLYPGVSSCSDPDRPKILMLSVFSICMYPSLLAPFKHHSLWTSWVSLGMPHKSISQATSALRHKKRSEISTMTFPAFSAASSKLLIQQEPNKRQ
jgi:hypothetical protein